jgi:hypothetical protein
MIPKNLIPKTINRDSFLPAGNKLVERMRMNPVRFIEKSSDADLIAVFPIPQKMLNKRYKGKLSKYRAGLIDQLRIGSMEIL